MKRNLNYDEIEVNDLVTVNFNNSQITLCRKAVVYSVPHQTGESWIVRDFDDHKLHYISEGCTITLLNKGIKKKQN